MKKVLLVIVSSLLLFACTKQEGEGGLATIKGIVMIQNINSDLQPVGDPYPAQDEDVFIVYGSNIVSDNDITTSPEGEFEFNYLLPGNYSLYVYSDDTSKYSSNQDLAVYSEVLISDKKEIVTTDTIIIFKYVDFDEGSAVINGTVFQKEYFPGSTTTIMDTIVAQDIDVFLVKTGSNEILQRAKTIYNGNYTFTKIIPGDYTVYVYGEMPFVNEMEVVSKSIHITEEFQVEEVNDLFISNYSNN